MTTNPTDQTIDDLDDAERGDLDQAIATNTRQHKDPTP